MDEGLPDPEVDREAWARLQHRLEVERKARRRSRFHRGSSSPLRGRDDRPDIPTVEATDVPPEPPSAATSEPPALVLGVYPNREAAVFVARSLAGASPALVLVGLAFAAVGALVAANPGAWAFWILLAALVAGVVAVAALATRPALAHTPTTVEFGSSGVVARWAGLGGRSESIPFDRISSVDTRRWGWMGGRDSWATFRPAMIWYDRAGDPAAAGTPRRVREGSVYLTDENGRRTARALAAWRATQPDSGEPDGRPTRLRLAPGWEPDAR